jgi:hypothetical protein
VEMREGVFFCLICKKMSEAKLYAEAPLIPRCVTCRSFVYWPRS